MELSLSTIWAIVAVSFIIGFIFGWLRHAKSLMLAMLDDPDKMIKLLNDYKANANVEEDDNDVHEMIVEKENGVFYLYEKNDKKFLAQGDTLELALEQVSSRFPNQKFQGYLSQDEAKEMGVV